MLLTHPWFQSSKETPSPFTPPHAFHKSWTPRLDTAQKYAHPDHDGELEDLTDDLLFIFLAPSWLSFDEQWLYMRDAYAKSIFDKDWGMKTLNKFRSKETAPFYDLIRGITSTNFQFAETDPTLTCSGYHAIRELTSLIIGTEAPSSILHKSLSYNLYIQQLLAFGDLRKTPSTFTSILKDPSHEFQEDENKFMFLSLTYHMLPSTFQHYLELHIRLLNHLYLSSNQEFMRESIGTYPTYPDNQLFFNYAGTLRTEMRYGPCFRGGE